MPGFENVCWGEDSLLGKPSSKSQRYVNGILPVERFENLTFRFWSISTVKFADGPFIGTPRLSRLISSPLPLTMLSPHTKTSQSGSTLHDLPLFPLMLL